MYDETGRSDIDFELMADSYRNILRAIGEDPDREGLRDTPIRAAKAMAYFTKGKDIDFSNSAQDVGLCGLGSG